MLHRNYWETLKLSCAHKPNMEKWLYKTRDCKAYDIVKSIAVKCSLHLGMSVCIWWPNSTQSEKTRLTKQNYATTQSQQGRVSVWAKPTANSHCTGCGPILCSHPHTTTIIRQQPEHLLSPGSTLPRPLYRTSKPQHSAQDIFLSLCNLLHTAI